MHVGHFQLNHVTGNASNELSISFIETKEAAIANSAKAIKEIMFNKDGTQPPPIEYLMRLKYMLLIKLQEIRTNLKLSI